MDQYYSRFCGLWRQIDALTPPYCTIHAAQLLICSQSCSRRRRHDETRRMYDFIMRLRPEFEQTRAQLLHASSAYSLPEAFSFVRAEETRLQTTFPGGGVLRLLPGSRLQCPRLLVLRLLLLIPLGLLLGRSGM